MDKPNIVFVLTDDQGYGDLACHGNDIIKTPHIDKFHSECIRMTNYHVGPTCAPTRAGLFTGHYANSTGVWHTIGGRSLMRDDEWTLASAFQEAGYSTGLFGKWHLGDETPYRPEERGFDQVVMHGGGGISQSLDYWGNDYFDDTYWVNGVKQKFEGYCTDVFFGEALKFIKQQDDKPFLCCITPNAPHGPFNVEPRYSDPYKDKTNETRSRFYGMITNIDENFGKLRDEIENMGLSDNTILIFMTDNGTAGGVTLDDKGYGIDGYNAGMRGVKGTPYEGGHRVPFLLHWKDGNLLGGKDIDEVTANVDFMPTLLDLCNVKVPTDRKFDGTSLKSLLNGDVDKLDDRAIVTDSQRVTDPIKWKDSCVIRGDYRLINGKELYNVKEDPEQRIDLSKLQVELVELLRADYEKWWTHVSKQFAEDIPLYIGKDRTTMLNTHDWRNEDCSCAWHQGLVREATICNGHFEVHFEEDGLYQFELKRWPEETDHMIAGGIDPDNDVEYYSEGIEPRVEFFYSGSKILDIEKAQLKIGEVEAETSVSKTDQSVVFEVELKKGPNRLQTYFTCSDGTVLGAYYVYAKLLK